MIDNSINTMVFKETQRFSQVWLWVTVIGADLLTCITAYQYFANHIWDPNKPLDGIGIVIVTPLMLGITLLTYKIRLETRINADGIFFKFYPFHTTYRHYKWSDLNKSFVRRYNPLSEYGGWGIRLGLRSGRAYNIAGNMGLQLEFQPGLTLLIGTQKPKELDEALKQLGQDRS